MLVNNFMQCTSADNETFYGFVPRFESNTIFNSIHLTL